MAYGVKYRLDYCNRDSDPLRIDILIDGYVGEIYNIEGADVPFEQSQGNSNKFPKLESVRATFADLSIYEDDNFNIESLITSDETKIKVKYYLNNLLKWEGYALPEFFQKEISDVNIVNITASDRLGILKNISIPIDYDNISFLDIIRRCIIETGVLLNIKTLVGFQSGSDLFMGRPLSQNMVSGQRLFNADNTSISAYDVLQSILDAFGCFITQREGYWYIINKLQHETGQGDLVEYDLTIGSIEVVSTNPYANSDIDISSVYAGGEELIQPILSSASILAEHGGSLAYPSNNNFRLWTGSAFNSWISNKGFIPQNYQNVPLSFNVNGYVNASMTSNINKLLNTHDIIYPDNLSQKPHPNTWSYLESLPIDIMPLVDAEGDVNISYAFNVTGKPKQYAVFSIVVETNRSANKFYTYSPAKGWIKSGNDKNNLYNNHLSSSPNVPFFVVAEGHWGLIFQAIKNNTSDTEATSTSISGDITIPLDIIQGVEYCKVYIRALPTMWYSSEAGAKAHMLVNSVSFSIKNNRKGQRGDLYRADRSGNYTAKASTPVSIFSDHIFKGLNGYFYDYPIDDTSQIVGSSLWRVLGSSEQLPLLQHTVRQMSKLYSVAHTDISVTVDIKDIPLNTIFTIPCKGRRYVITRYSIDYMRQTAKFLLSEIKIGANPDKEFIYSYFGDEGTSVSSLSNVGSSSGSGGGGARQDLQTTTEIGNTTTLPIKARGFRPTHFQGIPKVSPLAEDMEVGEWYMHVNPTAPAGETPTPGSDFYIKTANDANLSGIADGQVVSWSSVQGKFVPASFPSLAGYATQAWVNSQGFATQSWVNGQGFITQETYRQFGLGVAVSQIIYDANIISDTKFVGTGGEWVGSPLIGAQGQNQGYLNSYSWLSEAYKLQEFTSIVGGKKYRLKYDNVWGDWITVWDSLSFSQGNIDQWVLAYTHSQTQGNPHNTQFSQLLNKPTTLAGFGITDGVTKVEFDGLQVGGVNLFKDGERERVSGNFQSLYVRDIFENIVGQNIVVSFDFKCDIPTSVSVYPYQGTGISIQDSTNIAVTNTYKTFVIKTTVKNWGDIEGYSRGEIGFYDGANPSNQFYIKNIRIATGTLAQAYTPALSEYLTLGANNANNRFSHYTNWLSQGAGTGMLLNSGSSRMELFTQQNSGGLYFRGGTDSAWGSVGRVWSSLDWGVDVNASANSVVQRDGFGDLRARYFIDTNGSVLSSGIASIYGGSGSGSLNKYTKQAVNQFLGMPAEGDTLDSVMLRGSVTNNHLTIQGVSNGITFNNPSGLTAGITHQISGVNYWNINVGAGDGSENYNIYNFSLGISVSINRYTNNASFNGRITAPVVKAATLIIPTTAPTGLNAGEWGIYISPTI